MDRGGERSTTAGQCVVLLYNCVHLSMVVQMACCYNIGNPKVQKQKVALRGRELVEIALYRLDHVRVVVVHTRMSVHSVSA